MRWLSGGDDDDDDVTVVVAEQPRYSVYWHTNKYIYLNRPGFRLIVKLRDNKRLFA